MCAIAICAIVTPMKKITLVLIVHNVRSAHNVGSILRSADGFGISKVYFSGYTPYPKKEKDSRLPHIAEKMQRQISKTALGAEKSVDWEQIENIGEVINKLKKEGYEIAALEQTGNARDLSNFSPTKNIAVIVGNEVDGIDEETLEAADIHLQIPMQGKKESLNVAVAAAIAMYQLSL
jgi:23S rRNA (guanosine2251-2'-O)-methyltransferase